jgi:DNA polymerase-3 subunit alpha
MCTATLDDGITTLDVTIFSELYSANTEWLRVDELLVVKGKAGTDNYSGMTRVTAESIWNLAAARHHFGRGITISIGDHVDIHQLHERLDELRTPEGLSLAIRRYYKHVCYTLALDPKWKVSPDRDLATAVDELCGKNALSIDYGT